MTNPSDERALSIVKKSASRILDLSERTRTASAAVRPGLEPEPPVPLSVRGGRQAVADLAQESPDARVSVGEAVYRM